MSGPERLCITSHVEPGIGRCKDCAVMGGPVTRERVRQHVRQTGHTAMFIEEKVSTYSRPPDVLP